MSGVSIVCTTNNTFIKGSWTFSQLASTQDPLLQICEVCHTAGHWGILFRNRKTIAIFDNTPDSFRVNLPQQQKIFASLQNNQPLNTKAENAGEEPYFLLSTSNSDQYFVKIMFTKINVNNNSDTQRFYAILNTGEIYCWQWIKGIERQLYKWKWVCSQKLTEGETVSIRDIIFSPSGNQLIWWEADSTHGDEKIEKEIMLKRLGNVKRQHKERICSQILQFESTGVSKKNNDLLVSEVFTIANSEPNIIDGFNEIKQFYVTRKGIWLFTGTEICFCKLRSFTGFTVSQISSPSSSSNDSNFDNYYDIEKQGGETISGSKAKNKKLTNPMDVIFMTKHQNTDDILLLEKSGRILICEYIYIQSKIVYYELTTLKFSDYPNLEIDKILQIVAHKHFLFVFFSNFVCVCDIRSGLLLEKESFPFDFGKFVCRNQLFIGEFGVFGLKEPLSGDIIISPHQIGFWKPSHGVFEIQLPNVNQHIESISNRMNLTENQRDLFPVNYLGKIASNWNINRLNAKYTLRELLALSKEAASGSETEEKSLLEAQRELSETLLPHLQNPSLILLLLREKYHKPYLRKVVSTFLEIYLGVIDSNNNNNTNTNNSTDANLRSYHHHTPLNTTMISLLDYYNQLSANQKNIMVEELQNVVDNKNKSYDWLSSYLKDGTSLMAAPRSVFEVIVYKHPERALELLETHLGLNTIWSSIKGLIQTPEQTIFQFSELLPRNHILVEQREEKISDVMLSGARGNEHPLFVHLCRLYYRLQPTHLIPFVLLLQNSVENAGSSISIQRTFIDRAVASLPPILHHIDDSEFHQTQLTVSVTLLCLDGKGQRAVQYLLDNNLWDQIWILLRKYKNESDVLAPTFTPQSEIFHRILAWCIQKNDIEHLSLLWDFIPERFGVLNLMRVIKLNQSTGIPGLNALDSAAPPVLVDTDKNLTIGTFRTPMIEMFKKAIGNSFDQYNQ